MNAKVPVLSVNKKSEYYLLDLHTMNTGLISEEESNGGKYFPSDKTPLKKFPRGAHVVESDICIFLLLVNFSAF